MNLREEELLTLGEVAKRLGVSRVTVWRWATDGKIPARTRAGNAGWFRIPASWVEEHLARIQPIRRSE